MSRIRNFSSNDLEELSAAFRYARTIIDPEAYSSAQLSERGLWHLVKEERLSYWKRQDCRRIVERVKGIASIIYEQAGATRGGIDDMNVKEKALKIFKALESDEGSIGINYLLPKNFELIVRKLRKERIFGNDQNGSGVLWSAETFMQTLWSPSSFRRVYRKMVERPMVLQTAVEGRISLLVDEFQVNAVRLLERQALSKDWRKTIEARLVERFSTWPTRLSDLDEWYPLWDYVWYGLSGLRSFPDQLEVANINKLVDSLLPLDMPPRRSLGRASRIGLRQASRHRLETLGYARDGGLLL
ncbi:hypothetical protein JCM3765_003754 [Sporobolomyces pararoseus]